MEVEFPLEPRVSRWFHDSVAVERGPLVFSYGIGEDWLKLRDRGMTADWQVYPTTQWNYALALDPASPAHDIAAVETEMKRSPFSGKVHAGETPSERAQAAALAGCRRGRLSCSSKAP